MKKNSNILDGIIKTLVKRIDEMEESHWQKPWINVTGQGQVPQNIKGTQLRGFNMFYLNLVTCMEDYRIPCFLTFNQLMKLNEDSKGQPLPKEQQIRLRPDQHSHPVFYNAPNRYDKEGNKLTEADYQALTDEEKENCYSTFTLVTYREFNIDQTDMKEKRPELYDKLLERFNVSNIQQVSTDGMWTEKALDRLVEKQEWICPIRADKESDKAFFSPAGKYIQVPMKEQFCRRFPDDLTTAGQQYYSTLTHEMTHSTGEKEFLNRTKGKIFGDPAYAFEEMVAEMTAATVGAVLGFSRKVEDQSITYVRDWRKSAAEDPEQTDKLIKEVTRASRYLINAIDDQRKLLDIKPVLQEVAAVSQQPKKPVTNTLPDGRIINAFRCWELNNKPGEYRVRCKVDDLQLPNRKLTKEEFQDYKKGRISRTDLILKHYKKELQQGTGKQRTLKVA